MTPERWERVKEVFSAASALREQARTRYLDEACEGDSQLRAEVASLLDAHNHADAVVDRPAAAYVRSAALFTGSDRRIGQRIGAYEIVALIGHGGMGEVYRARRVDAEYDKEVAIKLVPAGYQREFVLQRLRAERQILANLDHPAIARLIDGGATDEGLPYLVMELVAGEPLDRYCEQRNLSVRERLQLFRDVCAAVSYAHQHLVVHRDLKPGNILVTADGRVKLLDFGIAKLLQPTAGDAGAAPTITLMQALTPGFASPEQFWRGDHHGERRLLTGSRVVSAAHRSQSLPDRARLGARCDPRSLRDRSRAAERAQRAPRSRSRCDHVAGTAQGTRQALPVGRSVLRGRPPPSRRSASRGARRSVQLSRREVRAPSTSWRSWPPASWP